jgi:hypothetical protein
MDSESPQTSRAPIPGADAADIIIIRDPEIDVEALMQQVRANVAQRRAAGAYQEDLDALADEVREQVLGSQVAAAGAAQDDDFPLLGELRSRWLIREPEFKSNAPVVGPLIVALRRGWNWMSTKWYVRGILDQQIGYNALNIEALDELRRAHKALAGQVAELQAHCAEQRKEITALREELAASREASAAGDTPA